MQKRRKRMTIKSNFIPRTEFITDLGIYDAKHPIAQQSLEYKQPKMILLALRFHWSSVLTIKGTWSNSLIFVSRSSVSVNLGGIRRQSKSFNGVTSCWYTVAKPSVDFFWGYWPEVFLCSEPSDVRFFDFAQRRLFNEWRASFSNRFQFWFFLSLQYARNSFRALRWPFLASLSVALIHRELRFHLAS